MLWKPLNVVVKSLDVRNRELGRSLQITAADKAKRRLKRPRTVRIIVPITRGGQSYAKGECYSRSRVRWPKH